MAVITQRARFSENVETWLGEHMTIGSMNFHFRLGYNCTAVNWELDQDSIVELPVAYNGDAVILDPSAMLEGMPYPFLFDGHELFARKQDDGSVDVYYLASQE